MPKDSKPRMSEPAPKLRPEDVYPPRTPVPEWLIRELIRLGDPEEKARARGLREAYAVADSMRRRAGLPPIRRNKG